MNVEEVAEALKISGRHISMDAPFTQGEENRLLDVIENDEHPAPDHLLMSESLKAEIKGFYLHYQIGKLKLLSFILV